MTEHSQYFSYGEKPGESGECLVCHGQTNDFLAYSPPGMLPLQRACCRGCIQNALTTMRELASGMRALGKTIERFKALFGKGE